MRKLIVACLAIAAFGVIPSMASAAPVLTHPTGTVAPVGTLLKATNTTESVLSNGLGTVRCSSAVLTGEVTSNATATGVKGNITSAVFGGTTGKTIAGDEAPECTGTGFYAGGAGVTAKPPYCLEATTAADTGKVRGGKCSAEATPVKFQLSVTVFGFPVSCLYEKASLEGSFTTDPSDAVMTLNEQEFVKGAGSGGECPSSGKLSVSITWETEGPTFTPVYFSP
jgi:hypothetical protein